MSFLARAKGVVEGARFEARRVEAGWKALRPDADRISLNPNRVAQTTLSLRELFTERLLPQVNPYEAIRSNLRFNPQTGIITLAGQKFELPADGRVIVVGTGKAGVEMGKAVYDIFGERAAGAICVFQNEAEKKFSPKIELFRANHPNPNEGSVEGARRILELAGSATSKDVVISVISGGGSAIMALPVEGLTLEDYIATNQLLSNAGARIEDWNAVRKHMDAVKGGRLALAAGNAKTIVNLMLSDVTGDRMDVIASGPFTPDPSTFEEALMVLEKYKIRDRVPRAVLEYLEAGAKGKREETAKEQLPNLHQLIVSSNTVAVNYVAEAVREWGYEVPAGNIFYDRDIAAKFKGVRNVAEAVTEILTQHRTQDPHRKIAIILGGEPTVNIGEECPAFLEGVSFGGRMQHLAALLIEDIAGLPVIALCAGTDCRDGTEPPEARKVAGAIIDGDTYSRALQVGKGKLRKGAKGYLGPLLGYELWELAKRVIPEKVIDYSLDGLVAGLGIGYRSHLEAGDSYDLHKRLGTHLGPERFVTNVMDVMVILYDPNLFERSPSIIPGLKRAGR